MKTAVVFLLFVFCYAECRKTYQPIDKNANLDFINMEGGGGSKPASQNYPKPAQNLPMPPTVKPVTVVIPTPKPVHPQTPPAPSPTPAKPMIPAQPVPVPSPAKPQTPNQIKPVPVNPSPVANPITTPGPGSVKQLINFYDSQGKASPIRPYSYSQAVKQG